MTYKQSSWEVVPSWQAKAQGNPAIDIGGGLSVTETSSTPLTPSAPMSPTPSMQPVYGDGGDAIAAPSGSIGSDIGLLLNIVMYPWMLLVGALAFFAVIAPATAEPPGLDLNPLIDVGAFGLTIWLYVLIMRFLPTALLLAAASAWLSGVIAWSLSDGAGFRRFTESLDWNVIGPADLGSALASSMPMLNAWVITAALLNLAAHLAFYWDSRAVKRTRKTRRAA